MVTFTRQQLEWLRLLCEKDAAQQGKHPLEALRRDNMQDMAQQLQRIVTEKHKRIAIK